MKLYKREKYLNKMRAFYDAEDIIKVITGVRRCGKSSLMYTIIEELKYRGVHDENIIYIDLDKRAYRKIKEADQLDELIEQYSENINGLKYLFIDEIQNVKGFEEVINGFRSDGEFSIFITGSNSYLLSGELVTKLTGRYLEFELFTLTFEEYIEMKKFYNKNVDANLLLELNHYILEGGFPRTIQLDDQGDKRTYTKGIIDEIFEKDIRTRVKIKDRDTFDAVQKFVINNYSSPISISSIVEELKKKGTMTTKITVSKYIKALLDAKIIYECSRFDMKSRKSIKGEKKYYLSDLSIYYSLNTDNRLNMGAGLENMVYFYIRSHDYSISMGRIGNLECDFVIRNKEMDYAYIQVAYTILNSRSTEDREYRSLEKIKDNYAKYVATTDYMLQKRNGIKHINILEFMMHNEKF